MIKITNPTPPIPDSARQRCRFIYLSMSLKISMRLTNELSRGNGTRNRGFNAFDEPGGLKSASFANTLRTLASYFSTAVRGEKLSTNFGITNLLMQCLIRLYSHYVSVYGEALPLPLPSFSVVRLYPHSNVKRLYRTLDMHSVGLPR